MKCLTIYAGKFEYHDTKESLMDLLTTDSRAASLLISKNCRVLTIHGFMDYIKPFNDAFEFAKLIHNHTLHIIQGADHKHTLHQEELVAIKPIKLSM
ncbi:hypothetical protein RJ641_022423 [Dillenia turbinata]|uniref:Uncharacterized protein n=1 Tax=Dillenia turbinata TaxID=194707 RepID=A0AAN8UMH8_9MAGN